MYCKKSFGFGLWSEQYVAKTDFLMFLKDIQNNMGKSDICNICVKDFLQFILLIFYFEYPLKTWGNPFLPHTVHFINQNQRIFYNSFNYVLLLFTSYIKIKGIFVINFIYILFWISYKNMRRCVFATYRTLRKPKARYFLQLVLLIFYLGCPLITWDNSLFATCFLIKSRVTWLYIYIFCIYMV